MRLQPNAGINALPCLTKIRFVAAELLNQLEVPVDGHASSEQMAERQRAYEYLSSSCGGMLAQHPSSTVADDRRQVPPCAFGGGADVLLAGGGRSWFRSAVAISQGHLACTAIYSMSGTDACRWRRTEKLRGNHYKTSVQFLCRSFHRKDHSVKVQSTPALCTESHLDLIMLYLGYLYSHSIEPLHFPPCLTPRHLTRSKWAGRKDPCCLAPIAKIAKCVPVKRESNGRVRTRTWEEMTPTGLNSSSTALRMAKWYSVG